MNPQSDNLHDYNSLWSGNHELEHHQWNQLGNDYPSTSPLVQDPRLQANFNHGSVQTPAYFSSSTVSNYGAFHSANGVHHQENYHMIEGSHLFHQWSHPASPYTGDGTEYLNLPDENAMLMQSFPQGHHQLTNERAERNGSLRTKKKTTKSRRSTPKGSWRDYFPQLKPM